MDMSSLLKPLSDASSPAEKVVPPPAEVASPQDDSLEDAAPNLEQSEREVEVHLHDTSSQPLSVKSFEDLGLHSDLLKGVYDLKFVRPSKIQERALPLLLSTPYTNMIGQSQSGTGKTAAFALTMLSRVDSSIPAPQALCLAPSRELAKQIYNEVIAMGKYTNVKAYLAVAGERPPPGPLSQHIIIGTPGKVFDFIRRNTLKTAALRVFVLDEADNMIDQQGLGDQSMKIRRTMPDTCQIVLFSATFPDVVREYASRFAPDSNMITLQTEELSVDAIKQFYMDCRDFEHKVDILTALYSLLTIGQSMIFTNRRDTADMLARRMADDGHTVAILHGKQEADERDAALEAFRDGRIKVLITTNVIARGIDVLQVNLVVNFDLPVTLEGRADPETYLHRIGRTGRFGRKGVSINFVHDSASWAVMEDITKYFGRAVVKVPTDDYEEIERLLRAYGVQ